MSKSYSCWNQSKKNNEKKPTKRTIRNNEKLNHWKLRNSSLQMNAILTPDDIEEQLRSECSREYIDVPPDEVTKKNGKLKWPTGNKKVVTHSRYHQKCLSKKQPKPKLKKTNIKRNIVSSVSCDQCGTKVDNRKFTNKCYCGDPPDKPLLPVKPVWTQPIPKRTIRSGFQSQDSELESTHTLQTLRKAKDLLHDYSPESEFLRRLRKEAQQVYDCKCESCRIKDKKPNLKFTEQRQLLEEAYRNVEKNDQCTYDKMGRQYHNCDIRIKSPSSSPKITKKFASLSPEISSNTSQRLTSFSSHLVDCDKIRSVKHIRDENYFDTHSTNVTLTPKNVPKHKCVHKFCLDNRLLPTPLNADGFGVSRCTFCNRPMESNSVHNKNNENVNSEDNYINLKKSNKNSCGSYLKAMDNKPRKINFATKTDAVEIEVPPILITSKKGIKMSKMLVPVNSWALRYQKGVI